MKVVAVDDEQISLECLEIVLQGIDEIELVKTFSSSKKTLEYINTNKIDVAFLDIEMSGMNGLELAANIRSIQPECKIIFVTSTPKYALNAIQLHVNGYLVKPVNKAAIEKELKYLKIEEKPEQEKKEQIKTGNNKLKVQTFGNFEVFVNGEPLKFIRSKSKELFAYLIDRRGTNCSVGELCAVLWEDRTDDEVLQSQLRKVISDLRKTLAAAGYENVLTKSRGYIAVLTDQIDCDYYNFLNKDIDAVNAFFGEYMIQYSWSEFTVGYLERQKK